MTIHSYGFEPSISVEDARTSAEKFKAHLPILLTHSDTILNCADYFFCELPFASCSWPYLGGDGLLYLGYLLMGWKAGVFTGKCPNCGGSVHVFSFAGSPLSGRNKWTGVCRKCNSIVKSSWDVFGPLVRFTLSLRQQYPGAISAWEEHDGVEFTWGGNGLRHAQKNRLVTHRVADSPSLDDVLDELMTGRIREKNPPSVSLLKLKNTLKLGKKRAN